MAALLAARLRSGSSSRDLGGGRGRGSGSGGGHVNSGARGRSGGSLNGGGAAGDSGRGSAGRGGGGSGGGGGSRGGVVAAAAAVGEGQGGAGDGVRGEVLVDVEENAGVALGVEGGAEGAVGQLGAGASDLEVEAHGVVLGAVRVLGRVQRDDLVAEHVVARLEGGGDGDVVGEVVCEQVVGGPHTRVGARDQARGVDLDPLEGGLVNGGRVIRGSDVVDDGAVVLGVGVS